MWEFQSYWCTRSKPNTRHCLFYHICVLLMSQYMKGLCTFKPFRIFNFHILKHFFHIGNIRKWDGFLNPLKVSAENHNTSIFFSKYIAVSKHSCICHKLMIKKKKKLTRCLAEEEPYGNHLPNNPKTQESTSPSCWMVWQKQLCSQSSKGPLN